MICICSVILGELESFRNDLSFNILRLWNSPQVIESSRQYLLLRTNILQKTVVGCPWSLFRVMLIKSQFFKKPALLNRIRPLPRITLASSVFHTLSGISFLGYITWCKGNSAVLVTAFLWFNFYVYSCSIVVKLDQGYNSGHSFLRHLTVSLC